MQYEHNKGGPVDAIYKRWIPNTNFENASNWHEQRLPCARDNAVFASNKKVSVFVQSLHSLTDLYLPLDGEFILSSSGGFMAASAEDPGCGEGAVINFRDTDNYQWLDPAHWQAAVSTDDLENGILLFSVDAERVPCRYDDVIFSPETSFQVQVQEAGSDIPLSSLSVLGKKFTNQAEFAAYLATSTGRLQFPGKFQPQVTNTRCQDKTGCLCGNEGVMQEICSAVLQKAGNTCPQVSCTDPLKPHGHCCGICGVIISLEYSSEFDLEKYRSRLIHTFQNLAKYSGVKLALSKVQSSPSVKGVDPLSSDPTIQIVLIDEKEGQSAGTDALQMGQDIMADIDDHGQTFGITKADMKFATGTTTSPLTGSISAGGITAIILGIIVGLSVVGAAYFLHRMDRCRFPDLGLLRTTSRLEEPAPEDQTFDNPIYDPSPESGELQRDARKEVSHQTGMQFANPVFDASIDV
ncbi:protein amnionless isoform X2 [Hyperolius riggenbachi]|uniref:protein amnionless isoform X2 n=1 Tax=Hyperolius riggenbachi TaxID=752182 RepID=UPI0035A32E29